MARSRRIRVLGCLIEKQRLLRRLPLSLTSLRSRATRLPPDPVVEYDEPTIRTALERLSRKGWTRLASGAGSRAAKYRHLLDEALGVSPGQLSLLAVLMLRGPQTPGELKQRAERLYAFGSLAEIEQTLGELIERDLILRLERRPGQKETRSNLLDAECASERAEIVEPRGPGKARCARETRHGARETLAALLPLGEPKLRRSHHRGVLRSRYEQVPRSQRPVATRPQPTTSNEPYRDPRCRYPRRRRASQAPLRRDV